jgi:glycosyltransferase involved in cell wall biosynthesis
MESVHILYLVFVFATGIQMVFFLFFLMVVHSSRRTRPTTTIPVSVLVCARNEEDNLRLLIPLLLEQQHPTFEIIVIDDRSFDKTYELVTEAGKRDSRIRLVHVAETPDHLDHKKYALTLGIKAANFECVLLTDADCRPASPNWISLMASGFERSKTDIVLGYSPYFRARGMLNKLIRFDTLVTGLLYISLALVRLPYMGVGRNLAYRKPFFFARKGFHQFLRVTGGDDDLFVNKHANARNTRVCIGPKTTTLSIPKTTVREFFLQKKRHLSVGREYRIGTLLLPALFMSSYLVSWISAIILFFMMPLCPSVFYWFGTRLLLFMVTCQVCAYRLGDRIPAFSFLLDFLYVIYYLSTAPMALFTDKARWKN